MSSQSDTQLPTVVLSAVEDADAEIIHGWYADETFRLISGARYPASAQRWRDWAAKHREPEFGNAVFAVRAECHDKIIGITMLRHPSVEDRSAEVAVMIGRAEHRRQGYGTAASIATLRFGFQVMGLHRIDMRILAHNAAALALAKVCGAVHEGTARDGRFVNGQFRDVERLSVLAHEFRSDGW